MKVGPVLVNTVINGQNEEIYVRPKFTKLNAPVQSVSDKSYGGKYLHNRAETRALNKSPVTSLFGDLNKRELGGVVADRIGELKTKDPLKGAVIEALAKEVKVSYAAQQSGLKSRHGISASNFSNQPYAVPARVALIANELDLAVDFNCKSGKDRTGMLDAQIQALMADLVIRNPGLQYKPEPTVRVEETEQTPAPAVNIPKLRSRSENTALVLKNLFYEGPAHQVQDYACGTPGMRGTWSPNYQDTGITKHKEGDELSLFARYATA